MMSKRRRADLGKGNVEREQTTTERRAEQSEGWNEGVGQGGMRANGTATPTAADIQIEFSHQTDGGTARRRPHAGETAITGITAGRGLGKLRDPHVWLLVNQGQCHRTQAGRALRRRG